MQSYEGGCLCSAVRYRAAGKPLYSIICHCKTCRRAGAAPSVAWLTFERNNFLLLSGTPLTFPSSPHVRRTFCGICGTPLTYMSDRSPTHVDVTTASMDDPTLFPPTQEVWTEEKISWEEPNARIDQYPRGLLGG